MADYIDRETVLKILEEHPAGTWRGYNVYSDDVRAIMRKVDEQPAADVAPVRRGEWLDLRGDYQTAKCSFCASQYEVTFGEESDGMLFDGFKRFYKYCPHCGAKMEVGNG